MKAKMILLSAAIFIFSSATAPGFTIPVVTYDSGVLAQGGATGAADPTTQDWTFFVGDNGWLYGGDSTNGGWRISDGTSTGAAFYQKAIDPALMGGDWTATWTIASNGDIVNASAWLDNWISGAESRQNNNAMWIEVVGVGRYILTVQSSSGVMQIHDGTTSWGITGHGFSQEDSPFAPGSSTTVMDYVTFTLIYDASTGTATLYDGTTSYGPIATNGTATQNRIVFGATSGAGNGSTTWNAIMVDTNLPAFELTESDGSTAVAENAGSDSYELYLIPDPNTALPEADRWPTSSVTVTVTPDTQVKADVSEIVFPAWTGDPNDYVATVTVTAVNDTDLEGAHVGVITHAASSSDVRWDSESIANITVDIADDDGTPEFILSEDYVSVYELQGDPNYPSQATYEISIPFPPTADVTVNIATDAQVTATASVTFTNADWDPKTVTVDSVDDGAVEVTPHVSTITHTVITSDLNYGTVTPSSMTVLVVDNEPLAPTSTTPHAWYLAETGVFNGGAAAADGESATLWGDQSGSSHNLNNVSGDGPVFEADSAKGGQPALRLDDGSLWAGSNTWGQLADATIFIVASMETGGDNYLFDSTTSSGRKAAFTRSSVTGYGIYAGTMQSVEQDVYTDSPAVYTAVFSDPNTGTLYFNGLELVTGEVGPQTLNGFMIGANYFNAYRMEGTISEVLVYDTVLTTAERQTVESYLMAKWLNGVEVYESNGTTAVTEVVDPNEDTVYIAAIGNHAAVSVTSDPDSELDLGVGADTSVVTNFSALSETEIQSLTVTAVDDLESEGPENHAILVDGTREIIVEVGDNEPYCGKESDQVYLSGDLNKDCYVDIEDIVEMAKLWLNCTDPFDTVNCDQILP